MWKNSSQIRVIHKEHPISYSDYFSVAVKDKTEERKLDSQQTNESLRENI